MVRASPLLLLLGCQPVPERYVVMDYDGGQHALGEVEIPWLTDPTHLSGDLGDGSYGGTFVEDGDSFAYRPGTPLQIRYDLVGDVAWPADDQALVLWSFYHHLGRAREDLSAKGYDLGEVFPVEAVSYLTAIPGDAFSFENAAWVDIARIFLLFPDIGADVPVAANAGVVRHEFGHAWFEALTGRRAAAGESTRALNEGFGDMVATLSLDDPAFIEDSLPVPQRDVRGDAAATADVLDATTSDPYALGTVFASFAWDIRLASDDPDWTLSLVVATVEEWALLWDPDEDPPVEPEIELHFADLLLQRALADRPLLRFEVCEAFAARFPERSVVGCL